MRRTDSSPIESMALNVLPTFSTAPLKPFLADSVVR